MKGLERILMKEKILSIFFNLKWYYIIIPIIITVLLIILLINPSDTKHIEESLTNQPIMKNEESSSKFKIDIKGEVVNPGVYEVDSDMIVLDAINLAGGLTKDGDTSNINLSEKLTESMIIIVDSKANNESKNLISKSNKVSLNKGTKEELMSLTGIGESKAFAIIEYRQKNRFTKVEDIMLVSGIGESTFAKIKDSITI